VPALLWAQLAAVLNPAFYVGLVLVGWYVLAGVVGRVARAARVRAAADAAAVTAALVLLAAAPLAMAADGPAAEVAPEGRFVVPVPPLPPVDVPEDALIVPYDAGSDTGARDAETVLVPYDRYVELWNRAHPDEAADRPKPPADYALAGASYTATLAGDGQLRFEGAIEVDVFREGHVIVPLPLAGGVLARADLDGKPAKMQVIAAEPPQHPEQRPRAQQAPIQQDLRPRQFIVLHVSGKGRHRLDLAVHLNVVRQGGWRVVDGRVPAAPATALRLRVPRAETELRFIELNDRAEVVTDHPAQVIDTAISAGGMVALRWRPKVGVGQVDRSLTADSDAVFDIREDGEHLAWRARLAFRQGQRESFTFHLPAGYLVEEVTGENVRGWTVREHGERQQLDVTLLKPATKAETVTLRLWRRLGADAPAARRIDAPVVAVAGAVMHHGTITIRRGALIDVKTLETAGVTRTDVPAADALPAGGEASPLGIRAYQAYRFMTTPFTITLNVGAVPVDELARHHTVLGIGERRRTLETRLQVWPANSRRTVHRVRAVLPDDLRVERVDAPGDFEWAVDEAGDRRVLSVYFERGYARPADVVIAGQLGEAEPVESVDLPRIELLDVRRQDGWIAVQVDPAFDVKLLDLEKGEEYLPRHVHWFVKPAQRHLTHLAIRTFHADYRGTLALTERQPQVTNHSVTNVRVTDRAIEETILVEFSIVNAGIREVSFLLPAWMAEAKISVPLLRQKTVEPIGEDEDAPVRVTLSLQDEVMNTLRVLIEHSRLLTGEAHRTPIPVVETGRTTRRYVALESAGRDEVVIDERATAGMEPISRRQKAWNRVEPILRGGSTQAFVISPTADNPALVYRIEQREIVETAGARIGLAETQLTLDANGAYRAVQVYRLHNATEQFLEITMPDGASLWSATVAGEPVKPARSDGGKNRLRIPLVKTAEGELDYAVRIKYGGRKMRLGSIRRLEFPLIRTVNINVEGSQVRLRLPETHAWFDFGGTMRQVEEAGILEAGFARYQKEVSERLLKTMRYGANEFARVRAMENWKQQRRQFEKFRSTVSQSQVAQSGELQEALESNVVVQQQAEQQARELTEVPQGEVMVDNRARMNDYFAGQTLRRSRNVVQEQGPNFESAKGAGAVKTFDESWFGSYRLGRALDEERDAPPADPAGPAGKSKGAVDREDSRLTTQQGQRARGAGQARPQLKLGDALSNVRKAPAPSEKPETAQVDGVQQQVRRYQQSLERRARRETMTEPAKSRTGAALFGVAGGRGAAAAEKREEGAERRGAGRGGMAVAPDIASLDVDLPRQGVEYQFTTPRGELVITARAVSGDMLNRLGQLGRVLALLVVVAIAWLAVAGVDWRQSTASTVLLLLGGISVLAGLWPVLGLIAVVSAVAIKIRNYLDRGEDAQPA